MPALSEIGFTADFNKNTGPHLGTGDFNRFSHNQIVEVINAQVTKTHDASYTRDASGAVVLIPEAQKRLDHHLGVLGGFHDYVANPANYSLGIKEEIISRYERADEASHGTDMLTRVRERAKQFPDGPEVVTDMDGTLTTLTDMHGHIIEKLPASFIAEQILTEEGRNAFARVFVSTWEPVLAHGPKIFKAAAKGIEVRDGVDNYFVETRRAGIKTIVLSANFEPFVDGVLEQIPNAEGTEVIAVRPGDLRATEKALVLEHMAKKNPNKPLIYIGDGTSDIKAIAASDMVACYLALEGSQFSAELTAQNIPHLTYRDFYDVTDALRHIYPDMAASSAK